jgi:deoxyribodipyrimidine photolyase-related protein
LQLLFADQLGPHFDLGEEILLPVVTSQFSKRAYHRQKAHLILYALRARGVDKRVKLVELDSYRDLLADSRDITKLVNPTSYPFRRFAKEMSVEILPSRGFVSSERDWDNYISSFKRLRLEDFYRQQRTRLGILVEGDGPVEGRWNFDSENRLSPPASGTGVKPPWFPKENEIDKSVREELDELERKGVRFIGVDGPRRFAGSREEALLALNWFIENRLDLFGPYEDAVDSREWTMSHSLLSAPMNLGLLDPIEVVRAAEKAYHEGKARIESVEAFVRQIIGWRDYVWHLYWHFGEDYVNSNALSADVPTPASFTSLDGSEIKANCLKQTIDSVSEYGWVHHIPRLMILGNHALQRGYNPRQMNDWFIDAFVDGTPWVMPANVIGMSLYADGGKMSTKPYAAGGSYLSKMTNYCGDCPLNPKVRVGENACPFTAGYWKFLDENQQLRSNHRMSNAFAGLRRLSDLEELREQESRRTSF